MTQNTNTPHPGYYNAHFAFSGYVNRAKIITPKKGNPYLSVSLCVLSGDKSEPNKMYIDAIVSGSEARELLENSMDVINSQTAVFGSFKVSDLSLSTYQNKEGNTIPIAKGRLILVTYLKAGEEVLKSSKADESEAVAEDTEENLEDPVSDETDDDSDVIEVAEVSDETDGDSDVIEVTEADSNNSSTVDLTALTQAEKDRMLQELLGKAS